MSIFPRRMTEREYRPLHYKAMAWDALMARRALEESVLKQYAALSIPIYGDVRCMSIEQLKAELVIGAELIGAGFMPREGE